MTIDEMIAVLQAAKAGKIIEFKYKHKPGDWIRGYHLGFNFDDNDYRVKPEPREWYICDGVDHERWVVVPPDHGNCEGEKVKVREVLE